MDKSFPPWSIDYGPWTKMQKSLFTGNLPIHLFAGIFEKMMTFVIPKIAMTNDQ